MKTQVVINHSFLVVIYIFWPPGFCHIRVNSKWKGEDGERELCMVSPLLSAQVKYLERYWHTIHLPCIWSTLFKPGQGGNYISFKHTRTRTRTLQSFPPSFLLFSSFFLCLSTFTHSHTQSPWLKVMWWSSLTDRRRGFNSSSRHSHASSKRQIDWDWSKRLNNVALAKLFADQGLGPAILTVVVCIHNIQCSEDYK